MLQMIIGDGPIAITTKKAYERFKETGECIYKYYGNRI